LKSRRLRSYRVEFCPSLQKVRMLDDDGMWVSRDGRSGGWRSINWPGNSGLLVPIMQNLTGMWQVMCNVSEYHCLSEEAFVRKSWTLWWTNATVSYSPCMFVFALQPPSRNTNLLGSFKILIGNRQCCSRLRRASSGVRHPSA
jgi:hypothetical protein